MLSGLVLRDEDADISMDEHEDGDNRGVEAGFGDRSGSRHNFVTPSVLNGWEASMGRISGDDALDDGTKQSAKQSVGDSQSECRESIWFSSLMLHKMLRFTADRARRCEYRSSMTDIGPHKTEK